MADPMFRGVIPALVTPFRDGQIDEAAFERLLERQIAGGVSGVVPVGTTGESSTLTHAEHDRIVELAVELSKGRVPVIAGAGSNCTDEAIQRVKHAKAAGCAAALVVAPYYNRPSQEGLYRHYAAIADACDLPVVIYNVPSRTGCDIQNETVARIAKIPSMVGIKDATGDLTRLGLMRHETPEGFALISGDDGSALGYMAQGGHGVISVTANVAPKPMSEMIEAAAQGRFAEALAINHRLAKLHKALFADASPSPTKFALAELGLCNEEVRLPIAPCSEGARAQVSDAMRAAGLV
jgi:4-hydroxy-tetrahydrodipicolinate synthase